MCHFHSISSGLIFGCQGVKESHLETTDSTAHSSETSFPFLMCNLTATLLVCIQKGQCRLLLNSNTFAGWVSGSLYRSVTWIFFWSLANHKYDLCLDETLMLNKPGKSFMQPMKSCLQLLNSYSCHTHLYARLWRYLSCYSKLVDLCVWILFKWYQKLKVSYGGF